VQATLDALRRASLQKPSPYVELVARSNFSFLRGASAPSDLVRRAKELGHDTLAITDVHGLYGMVRALEACETAGLRLVVGAEVWLGADGASPNASDESVTRIVLHVQDLTGYQNLCRILTMAHAARPRDQRHLARVSTESVCTHAAGLFAMLMVPGRGELPLNLADTARALHQAFRARFSLGTSIHKDGFDRQRLTRTLDLSRMLGAPVCATNDVAFAEASNKPVHDVLTCIREGLTLDEAGTLLLPNAESCLKSGHDMMELFSAHPEWIARGRSIAQACTFSMRELRYKFPSELRELASDASPQDLSADHALARLTKEGAMQRYPQGVPAHVQAQVDKELSLIQKLEVAAYFLSVREVVQIARSKDILCQGRGSAANSAVCFCLGITAVDPARSSLLFERFLSAERREPPDIDVDFEHERREEVIQEIYARYGRHRAAMVSEVICYRGKSGLREVGKVFGLSIEQVDRLSSVLTYWDSAANVRDVRLKEAGFDPYDGRVRAVLQLAQAIEGFPRHLSIHVGGFVLSAEDLSMVAPVEPATMPERTVIPWDKDDLDTLGFFKIDVLGLGMLTALRKALDAVKHDPRLAGASTAIDRLASIPAEDPAVYEALGKADTVGVFQIESRAQMAMLPRLRPRAFYDLVVEVAIVRPGPIQGGMVHPYLRRRMGKEPAVSPHPILEPILARTLGVPLFQEQVMQIAIVGAGYTGGEADQLRRDMAAWKRNGRLERHKPKLLEGFLARGISSEFAERLYAQIQGFGEYGFPESHAASFALLVYASSWIKVHHPAAFASALVNSQPMGFYSPSTILQDAERHGVPLLPLDIQKSAWDVTEERAEGGSLALRMGLRIIKGLGQECGARIVAARTQRPFVSVQDLAQRAQCDERTMRAIAESGALDGLVGHGRREALWAVMPSAPKGLFEGLPVDGTEQPAFAPMPRAEQLVLDYERTGLSVADHPMRHVRPRLPTGSISSRELAHKKPKDRVQLAGLVICRQRPATASGVVFATLEDEFGFVNLVLWAKTFERFRHVATGSSLLFVRGVVDRDGPKGEVIHVIATHLSKLALPRSKGSTGGKGPKVPPMSRDFH